jgi:uncharacterized protein YjgD (DUF1641 family)
MKKTNILWGILNSIFLIVFNAFFFVLGDSEHQTSVWISYGFIHFAYLMLLLTPKLIRSGKSKAVFGFSLYSISAVYFLVEFVTGIIFILVSPESSSAALLVQLCIAGLYGVILVSSMIANEHTADAEEKRQDQIAYVKDASAKLKSLLENISDKETKKKVERVYDAIYSSPVKSHPDLEQKERNILQSINELEREVVAGNKEGIMTVANSLLAYINERNKLLNTLN